MCIGFVNSHKDVLVLNPSTWNPTIEQYPMDIFGRARRHVGTDNDVVLCFPFLS